MKRKLTIALTSVLLVVGMIFAFCACSAYGSVKRAYTKAGYEESEFSDTYQKYVTEMFGEDAGDVFKVHVLQKAADEDDGFFEQLGSKLTVAVIAEFNSTEEMNELMKKHVTAEDAEKIAEAVQKLDNVSGNCVLLFYSSKKGYEIFKGTK